MDITNKRVLLIGATGGIGQKITEVLQSAGAKLFLVGRNQKKLQQMNTQYKQGYKYKPEIITADINTAEGRNLIFDYVKLYAYGINVIINCAGTNRFALFEKTDEKNIREIIETNLIAPLCLIHMLLPELEKQDSAHILNIGSTFGSIGFAGFSIYCASKFALRGFTEAIRRELADTGITVSYLAPRATHTELNNQSILSMNRELNVTIDSPEYVAEKVLDILTSDKREMYIGWPEKLFVKLNGLMPRLVDKVLKKQLPVIKQYAGQSSWLN